MQCPCSLVAAAKSFRPFKTFKEGYNRRPYNEKWELSEQILCLVKTIIASYFPIYKQLPHLRVFYREVHCLSFNEPSF